MNIRIHTRRILVAAAIAIVAGCAARPPPPMAGLERIEHIVVIFAENRSFDHLYGRFPGANGLANATADQMTQLDRDGKPLRELPPAWKGKEPDPAFPHKLVAFYKPQGSLNQHPSYTDVESGDRHIADLLAKIKASPLWASTAIIIVYDENGGFWDHAPPPKGDRWGPGTRVPAIVVSPFAKKGYVDQTQYDTTSIIKFITRRFGLEPLPGVRPGAGDLASAFDLAR